MTHARLLVPGKENNTGQGIVRWYLYQVQVPYPEAIASVNGDPLMKRFHLLHSYYDDTLYRTTTTISQAMKSGDLEVVLNRGKQNSLGETDTTAGPNWTTISISVDE